MKAVVRALVGATVMLLACNSILSVPDPVASPVAGPKGDAGSSDAIAIDTSLDGALAEDAAPDASLDDASVCSGTPGALASDPKNCGSCGHDCLGGACEGGACQPIPLVANAGGVIGIALDQTNLYYTQYSGQCVSKVPKAGGGVELISAGVGTPWEVLSDGTNVYWTDRTGAVDYASATSGVPGLPARDGGSLGACGMLDAGAVVGTITTLASVPGGGPYGIATDGLSIYWTDLGGPGGVWRAPIAGSHPTEPELVSAGPCTNFCQTGVTVSGPDAFWMTYSGYVYRTALDAGSAAQISGIDNVDARFIAADDTNVYWTMSDGNSVWTVPVGGGETVAVSQVEATPWAIVVDASGVYWVDSGGPAGHLVGNAVRRARFEKGSWKVVTMASDLGTPMGIATDEAAIYWAENGSGRVMKLAK